MSVDPDREGGLDRREFIGRAARAGAALAVGSQAGWLAACGGSDDPADDPDLRSLVRRIEGRVVAPGQPGFRRASRLYDPRFDATRPMAVAYLESPEDARQAVEWAREGDVPIVARNGGHSYGGYSTVEGGLVADVTRMNRIDVDPSAGRARIGAGSLLANVYAALARHGVTIPAGSCPTVGVTGLTLGGGIGLSGRKLGLTCDSLVGAELVTATGELVRANGREHQDLRWACRGGGGGNFGIATELEFEVHPVGEVAIYDFEWAWQDAEAVFDAWQRSAPRAPDELFSICKLQSTPTGDGRKRPSVTSFGQLFGSRDELEALLAPLLDAASPTKRTLTEMRFLDAQLYWAGCKGPPGRVGRGVRAGGSAAECIRSAKREAYKAKSHYVATPFPGEAVETMLRWVEDWPGSSNPNGGAIQMDASGGAINRVPADATAFVHRDDLFHCQYLAYWGTGDPEHTADANLDWSGGFYSAMSPYASGRAYQNYIDPELENWAEAYYAGNYARLQEVKAAYDPDNVFTFQQAVS
jgi:FAD/FMN-containing dehydrogenase